MATNNPVNNSILISVKKGKMDIKTRKLYNVLTIRNIDPRSIELIIKNLIQPKSGGTRVTLKAWPDKLSPKNTIHISMPTDEVDAWLNGNDFNVVATILIRNGYDPDEVFSLKDDIAVDSFKADDAKIQKLGREADANAIEMWKRFLSKINDPLVKKQIELYSRIFLGEKFTDKDGNERVIGHIVSAKNANLIRTQDPTATFVLARSSWLTYFNRKVRAGAKPFYYWRKVTKKGNQQDYKNAQNKLGWGDVNQKDMPKQAGYQLDIASSQDTDDYAITVGYDVRDTYVIKNGEDFFNKEIGFMNNLLGQLNKIAEKEYTKATNQDLSTIDGNDVMMKRTEKACIWMSSAFPQFKSTAPDPSNKLADYLLEYCKAEAHKKTNTLKQQNINIYAENGTQVVLILTNLGLDALKRFNIKYEYTQTEAANLMSIVWDITRMLEQNSMITEGIASWLKNKWEFAKRFVKALKMIGCSIIKNKFKNNKSQEEIQQDNTDTVNSENNADTLNQIKKDKIKNDFFDTFNKINKNYNV